MGHGSSKEKSRKQPQEVTASRNGRTEPTAHNEAQSEGKTQDETKRQDSGVVRRRNKAPQAEKRQQQRISFYETIDADEILPYLIVGNLPSAKNAEFLQRKNVCYVLNLTPEPHETQVEGVEYKNVAMEDDEEEDLLVHLDECFDFVNRAKLSSSRKETRVVLVHSYFGLSRTSAVVLAYLMKEHQWSLREAYDHMKERHPLGKPNDGFVVQLLRYEQELHGGKISMTLKDFYK